MEENTNILSLPVLPLKGIVVFPEMILHFDVGRKKSKAAIDAAMENDQEIFITAQKDPGINKPKLDDIYKVGVVCSVTQIVNQSDGIARVTIQGQNRAKILNVTSDDKFMVADIEALPNISSGNELTETALLRSAKAIFDKYVSLNNGFAPDYIYKVNMCDDSSDIADYISSNLAIEFNKKQALLEETVIEKRLQLLINILTDELYIVEIENNIVEKTKEKIDKSQKEYFLREQLSIIHEELGDQDNTDYEAEEYREKIIALNLDKDIEDTLLKECSKLSKMGFGNQEATVIRNYLDTCLELPWNTRTVEIISLKKVKASLDSNHFGLEKVKERIIEQLAVRKLNPQGNPEILCLVGPPGVGKTSIAQSIAWAINRKCARIALGGVHDEAEIRGHRRTYIGSMPGRIITSIKKAGSKNPLIILDEVDKLGNDYKGDPTSALLEVLDGEQNSTFVDHYIEVPFDLSEVMFITTANDLSLIPLPLRDRMDIIEIPSYTREEKYNIARKHLVKKQMIANGLTKDIFKINAKGIYSIIDNYTREAGVRTLERTIATIMRKSAVKLLNGEEECISITDKNISDYLGAKKYVDNSKSKSNQVGLVNGLAWTSVGGTLLPIEVAVLKGKNNIQLTGSLGDVMQESAKIALTCIRCISDKYKIANDFYKNSDIHIHAPEGAVPKDGPSAGITMATAIFSALTGTPVYSNIAMTGEITLRGTVMPIGGLREKSMAAYSSGIKKIIIPFDNLKDLEEVDPVVKEKVEFIPVKTITEVLEVAIVDYNKTIKTTCKTNLKSDKYRDVVRQ